MRATKARRRKASGLSLLSATFDEKVEDQRLELVQLAVKEMPGACDHVQPRLCEAAPPPTPAPPQAAPRRRRRPAPASSRSPDAPRCRARSAPPAARPPPASRATAAARARSATKAPNENPPNHSAAPENAGALRPPPRRGRPLRRGRCRMRPPLAPTPRKLKRNAGAPHSIIARARTCVTLLSMVPPNSGCGWQATPNTRGRRGRRPETRAWFPAARRDPRASATSARVTAPCRRCCPSSRTPRAP